MTIVWMHRVLTWAGGALIAGWAVWVLLATFVDDAPTRGNWWLLLAGIVCMVLRSWVRGMLVVRLHRDGRQGRATISSAQARGPEKAAASRSVDLRMRVVPEAGSGDATFEAFARQEVPPSERDAVVEGASLPVVYDPRTGLAVLSVDGTPNDFGPGTLARLGRMRRLNRAAG
ncbi:hypothetical protein [Microbacterium sp. gxy059]|uniref:hypothetical protein n=1 Tax=Microbacterium sp. gxy059 TaxID=2957199 RepID=UPI003D9561D8